METDCTAVVFFLTSFHKRGADLFRINLGGPQELVDRPSQVTRGKTQLDGRMNSLVTTATVTGLLGVNNW